MAEKLVVRKLSDSTVFENSFTLVLKILDFSNFKPSFHFSQMYYSQQTNFARVTPASQVNQHFGVIREHCGG
jgi:hypothetical protein